MRRDAGAKDSIRIGIGPFWLLLRRHCGERPVVAEALRAAT